MALQVQSRPNDSNNLRRRSIKHPVSMKIMNTVIVFEFEDTLFPTTKLEQILKRPNKINYKNPLGTKQKQSEALSKMTTQEILQFADLSSITYNLLSLYIKKYSKQNICIVSTSKAWMIESLSMVYNIGCYDKIYHLLFDSNDISIYDLPYDQFKSIQKRRYVNGTHRVFTWKYETFKQIFAQKSIISGDCLVINTFVVICESIFGYCAAGDLQDYVNRKYHKYTKDIFVDRIKLKLDPTIREIAKEQNTLSRFCVRKTYVNHSLHDHDRFDATYSKKTRDISEKSVLH